MIVDALITSLLAAVTEVATGECNESLVYVHEQTDSAGIDVLVEQTDSAGIDVLVTVTPLAPGEYDEALHEFEQAATPEGETNGPSSQ